MIGLARLAVVLETATTLGALTYPLYLLHEDIGWTVIDHVHGLLPDWAVVAVLTAGFLGAAWLVHRFVERPLSGWLKRELGRVRPPAVQQAA